MLLPKRRLYGVQACYRTLRQHMRVPVIRTSGVQVSQARAMVASIVVARYLVSGNDVEGAEEDVHPAIGKDVEVQLRLDIQQF